MSFAHTLIDCVEIDYRRLLSNLHAVVRIVEINGLKWFRDMPPRVTLMDWIRKYALLV